jgi:hypothetical protein
MPETLMPGQIKYSWIKKELVFPKTIKKGDKTRYVKYIQEWLCFHNFKTGVDQDFGPATQKQVKNFQKANNLSETGAVNIKTYAVLTHPILKALTPVDKPLSSFSKTFLFYAKKHLSLRPIEIGGQNKGPWVRLYMSGHEGSNYPWCAGFASFLIRQVKDNSSHSIPIKGSWSCDSLAAQAKEANIFVSENDIKAGRISKSELLPGSIFLSKRSYPLLSFSSKLLWQPIHFGAHWAWHVEQLTFL